MLDRSSNWPRTRRFTEWSGRTARPCGPPTSVAGSLPSCWRPERGDSAQDKDTQDKDTQDKDTQDSSGNNHASRVRSDGALIQMADRDDSMLYVYELPTKAAMESMDPTWADIRIFKPSGLDLPVRVPNTLTLTRVATVAKYSGAQVSITGQYADSNAANHGVTGPPGHCQRAGDVRQFRRRLQPFGWVGH